MEKVTDLILPVIINTIKTYHKDLYRDFEPVSENAINLHAALTLLLIEGLASVFKYEPVYMGHEIRIRLMEGKIVENDEIFDDQCWVELNGFVIDLLGEIDVYRLEFDKGIAEKLKEDTKTHFPVRPVDRDEFYFVANEPLFILDKHNEMTIIDYVKSILR